MSAKPNVVLVHGAFADASSWSQVIQRLQAAGHAVSAVPLDLASLTDDIARTRAVLTAQAGPTVLVGHSYGGAVITGAGVDTPHVISLVYVAAFAPDEGETLPETGAGFPAPPGNAHIVPDYRQGFLRVDPAAYPQYFMQDVHPAEARALAVTPDGNTVTYTLYHGKTPLENMNQPLSELAGHQHVLQLKLVQQITQGQAA